MQFCFILSLSALNLNRNIHAKSKMNWSGLAIKIAKMARIGAKMTLFPKSTYPFTLVYSHVSSG